MREGNWIWQSSGDDIDYTRFQPGEPNGNFNENCLVLYFENGNWIDLPCSTTMNFQICERPASKPTAVAAAKTGKFQILPVAYYQQTEKFDDVSIFSMKTNFLDKIGN